MKRAFLGALALVFVTMASVLAQSPPMNPAMTYGTVPTVGQWNNWFTQKQDTLGFSPLNLAGGTMTGRLVTTASTVNRAGFAVLPGVAPTTPANGDIWATSSGLYARVNNATVGPMAPASFASVNSTLTLSGGVLGVNLGNANTWSAAQTFVAPVLGAATATSINGLGITATTGTLTVAGGKTATVSNTLSLAGTDATTMTFPGASDTVVTLAATQTLTNKTLTNPIVGTQTVGDNTTKAASTAFVTGAVTTASVIRSYLAGYTLSNDGGTPNTVLDTSAGSAADSTNAVMISAGAFTKSTAGAWALGSGSNGMGNGLTVAASTWYTVCLANNGGTPDQWFDTSVTCANRPAGISDTKYRRIGSFRTNGSSQIIAFSQNGDEFLWSVPVQDISTAVLGTTATLFALTVPTGVKVNALLRGFVSGSGTTDVLINSPDEAVAVINVPSGNETMLNPNAGLRAPFGALNVRTNTSAQVRAVAGVASTSLTAVTYGWVDTRGSFN